MKYLLVAEADRIQDLLFRSSQLREVVGGSQLLSRFCEEVPHLLGVTDEQVITRGGGSFYVEFESKEEARRFGAALPEAYHRATGGTLSVAEPVEFTKDYGASSEEAGERLRRAKRRGRPMAGTQMPYVAFCESCGVGLAEAHEARFDEEEGHYLCPSCRIKTAEREEHSQGNFLRRFYEKVKSKALWPPTPDPEDVARYDPRDYVAYIVADGDGMGKVFGKCNKTQSKALSAKMDDVLQEALAEPTGQFMDNVAGEQASCIPVLPLILGGDDLFVLVPARWALDIVQQLCRTFQDQMTQWAQDHDILHEITMTAAVVICKANYPYYLAHQIGDRRLHDAKRVVKALAREEGVHLSAVDFEVVLGSQAAPKGLTGERRPTLRPYWVTKESVPSGWGLSVNELLRCRRKLVPVPSRRISQLRDLFDRAPRQIGSGEDARWNAELEYLLGRIERDWDQEGEHPVRAVLKALGVKSGIRLEDWYSVDRASDKEDERPWRGHGLPDLLRAWDWALKLDLSPREYEGGTR
jgi:hypothetical protein